ncbi:MAG: site-specific integrase [Clostridia bacterium]|nr:site-specific integrase [Clostridia bacterium]
MKITEWMNRWLEECSTRLKWSTIIRYSENSKCHICPMLGDKDLEDLSADTLQDFIRTLEGKGLAYNTIASIVSTLKMALQEAMRTGVTKVSNTGSMRLPEHTEKEAECFTVQEQKKIIKAVIRSVDLRLYGILISAGMGLRIGELLALTWDDVNLHSKTIRICKTSYYAKDRNGVYGRIVTSPKTHKSARAIPIPDILYPYIKELYENRDCKHVISWKGKPVKMRTYQALFSRLLSQLGIRHRGFHALRHTFATRALECGIDVKTTSEILGHSNINITLQRYTHVLMEHMRKELGKMEMFFMEHDLGIPVSSYIQSTMNISYPAACTAHDIHRNTLGFFP